MCLHNLFYTTVSNSLGGDCEWKNIKNIQGNVIKAPAPNHTFEKTKAYQDFINVLSQIIEKHGAEVLCEINRAN